MCKKCIRGTLAKDKGEGTRIGSGSREGEGEGSGIRWESPGLQWQESFSQADGEPMSLESLPK